MFDTTYAIPSSAAVLRFDSVFVVDNRFVGRVIVIRKLYSSGVSYVSVIILKFW